MTFGLTNIESGVQGLRKFIDEHLPNISAETLGWLATVIIHCATIPTLLSLLSGLSDRTPNLDIVLFMWTGLILMFGRAVILKDALNIITIGVGFMIQAGLMALILFK